MAKQVLNIVNAALGMVGESQLDQATLDAGTQRIAGWCKNRLQQSYRAIVNTGKEEFSYLFQLSTVAGVNVYTLPVSGEFLETVKLTIISSTSGQSFDLQYYSETYARSLYPNLSDIPSGKPNAWFFSSTTTPGTKNCCFINKPDAIYTVQGTAMVIPTDLTAVSNTQCTTEGDEWLQADLSYFVTYMQGKQGIEELQKRANYLWDCYLATDLKNEVTNTFNMPYQHFNQAGTY